MNALEELAGLKRIARSGGGPDATERQHARGKLTAHERIALLLDEGSFQEVEALRRHRATGFGMEAKRPYGDGVVTGWGTVHDRTVFVYAHDFRVFGGSLGEAHAAKIHKVMDLAATAGAPLVSLNDGAGERMPEGVSALAGYGGIFVRNTRSSGVIPQLSVMLGPCPAERPTRRPSPISFSWCAASRRCSLRAPMWCAPSPGKTSATTPSGAPTCTPPPPASPRSFTTMRKRAWMTCVTCCPCSRQTTARCRPACSRQTAGSRHRPAPTSSPPIRVRRTRCGT